MAEDLIEHIRGKVDVVIEAKLADKLKERGKEIKNMTVDLMICIGGDGTILRTLHSLEKPIPVLGINMGALGFLAPVQPENAIPTVSQVLEGFRVERRERLSVKIGDEKIPYAMNEAVVITSRPAKMLRFAIFIDDTEIERMRADGIVFATPTGSTAYAMSAGGPIVDPRVDAHIIVPIAPFKLSVRPTIVDASRKISLELLEMKTAELVVDGQFHKEVKKGEMIDIIKGEPAFFVRLNDKFFLMLRDKLRSEEKI
ncbi:MAG: NAD(+)/NADH kinase [Candidatus Methanospirareceae archaeon]